MRQGVILWLLLLLPLSAAVRTFTGDQLISTVATSEEQLNYLQELERANELDFWTPPERLNEKVNIYVRSDQLDQTKQSLLSHHLEYRIQVEDVQRLVDNERNIRSVGQRNVLTSYGTLDEINSWLDKVAANCGNRCSLSSIGKTFEGRDIMVIKIVASNSTGNKSSIFVDGGIHAREWISPVFVNNIIHKLINDYGVDEEVTDMLDSYDWYILPVLNPDGYQYTHDNSRLWRKNRAVNANSSCIGVDLNRNFGYGWGRGRTSNDPCNTKYKGPTAFSEHETQAFKKFLTGLDSLKLYLSFHAFGQYVLFPYSDAVKFTPNYYDLRYTARAAIKSMKKDSSYSWLYGLPGQILYNAGGVSQDWAYAEAGAEYSFTFELPPTNHINSLGFLLPESEIPSVVESVWPGVKTIVKQIGLDRMLTTPTPSSTSSANISLMVLYICLVYSIVFVYNRW